MNKFRIHEQIFLVGTAIVLLAAGCNSNKPVTQTEPDQIIDTTLDQASQEADKTSYAPLAATAGTASQKTPPVTTPSTTPKSSTISYSGVDGKTALELLKSSHKIETQSFSGVGEFVKSIDGVTPDKDHFWAFYVNGKTSTVGASSYTSKSSDKIEWKLDKIGAY